jgi:transcriptional regulator with XRE-family HTH domain
MSNRQWDMVRKARAHRALGRRLRAARGAAGITQERAAEVSGVSYSFISQCENGYYCPSIPVLRKLARAYLTSASAILEGL